MKTSISYIRIWTIAYPIIIGSIAQNIINVTDTAFLGQVGQIALGGGAIGGIFYMSLVMFGWGFGVGTQIVVARRYGEGAYRPIGRTVEHGFLFLMLVALVVFALIKLFGNQLISVLVESESIVEASSQFIRYRIWGIFFAHTNFIFRALYVGIGQTRVITFTTLVMVMVNVFLDYALIFGNSGFPQMGVSGAALASTLAEVTCSISFIVYTFLRVPLTKYRLFNFKVFSPKLLFRLLRISVPMMVQNFLAYSVWFLFFLIIEKMGEAELAVSNIIRSLYLVLMIPIMGFASATNTLVSYVIGKGKEDEVLGTIAKILLLCVLGVVTIVSICSIFPKQLLSIYTNDDYLISLGIPILYIISVASVMLSIGFIFFSGVSGTGKTNVTLGMEVIVLSIYLLLTISMVNYFDVSITAVWMVEILYGTLLSLFSFLYLRSKRWIGKKV